MRINFKHFLGAALATIAIGCSDSTEDLTTEQNVQLSDSNPEFRVRRNTFYTPPTNFPVTVNLVDDYNVNNTDILNDSDILNQAIKDVAATGGKIIMPKGRYHLGKVIMLSNVHIEVERGTVILPIGGIRDGRPNRIFDFGGPGQAAVENTSITTTGGRFTVDLTGQQNLDVYFARLGEVTNFRLANFNIKDQRTEFASILINFINKRNVDEPWPHNGIIENITQRDAHTGYGLIQGYAGDNILFRNLRCTGGVTLRMETDDQQMRLAGKGGLRNIFAKKIACTNGITPVMLSPHFQENGSITVDDVTATGCAYAVRVEHGFIEIFGDGNEFDPTVAAEGRRFRSRVEGILGAGSVSAVYIRNRGTAWAVRIANAFNQAAIDSTDPFIVDGLEGINPGFFTESNITNVKTIYRASGAKSKQSFLRYLPCSEWSKICRPTTYGVPNGFEYDTPSLGVTYDITTGDNSPGNYIVNVSTTETTGFPNSHVLNVNHNTNAVCRNGVGTIATCN